MSEDAPNPYAPPASEPVPVPVSVEAPALTLASPWLRFCSALVDGLVNLGVYQLLRVTALAAGLAFPVAVKGEGNYAVALVGIVVFYAIQWWSLRRSGQTLGKMLTGIRIVTMTGDKPSMFDLIVKRYGFMNVLQFIPFPGNVIGIIDVLCVFRKDRRCLHDLLAGTRVVRVVR